MRNPGILKERLVLEAPVDAADDGGGAVRSYVAAAFVWAAVEPLEARADMADAGAGAIARHRITVRSGPEITTRHRLRRGSRVWRVVALREADGSGRFLTIEAEEHVD